MRDAPKAPYVQFLIRLKKLQTVLSQKLPLLCGFNIAIIIFAYLIHYVTQLTTYPIPSPSKIPAAIPSYSRHLIHHLKPVYTSCIQFLPTSHTLKLTAFYININNTVPYIYVYIRVRIYRMFHDLWTLLQKVISQVFVIKKVHVNMYPILDGYGVITACNLEQKVTIIDNKRNKIINQHNTR